MADEYWRLPYTANQLQGAATNQVPRISTTTGNWEVWDIDTSAWVDTGVSADASVTKCNNTNIAPVESTSTASQAYAVNSFLVYNGQLYRAIAAIAQGDTLTVGTNIAAADVGTYLATISNGNYVASFNSRTGAVTPQSGDYTAAMVSAAPDGYGLGSTRGKQIPNNGNLDNITEAGLYYYWGGAANLPTNSPTGGTSFRYYFLVVYGYDNSRIQIAYDYTGLTQQRFKNGSSWQPWEWVNPPIDAGTEYRTTERFLGKSVYVRAIPSKSLSASGTTTFDGTNAAMTNLTHIIRVDGYVGKAPLAQYKGITGISVNSSNQLTITTSGATAADAYPVVYYLKD